MGHYFEREFVGTHRPVQGWAGQLARMQFVRSISAPPVIDGSSLGGRRKGNRQGF
jgi:hypothetical protein